MKRWKYGISCHNKDCFLKNKQITCFYHPSVQYQPWCPNYMLWSNSTNFFAFLQKVNDFTDFLDYEGDGNIIVSHWFS